GWWRGEEFWRGMPRSYYAAKFRAAFRADPVSVVAFRDCTPAETWTRARLPAGWADAVWGTRTPFMWGSAADEGAVPVLVALAGDSDPRLYFPALWAMQGLGRQTAAAAPAMLPLLDDPAPLKRA